MKPGDGSSVREISIAVLILGAALTLLFWKIPLLGHVQVPADILAFDPTLQDAAPLGSAMPRNPLLGDAIHQFHVWHRIAADFLQVEGRIPLWNPYVLGGQPLLANAQSALFHLPNLLLRFASAETVANTRVFFNVMIAGIFTFLFCRSLGVTFGGAILAGVSFAFSGGMMVGPGHPYANCLAWLPFSLWAGEHILAFRRVPLWSAVLGLGLGLAILGGHPETSFHVFCIVVAYLMARLLLLEVPRREKGRTGFAITCAFGVGILVGAVQWIPFATFLAMGDTSSRSPIGIHDAAFYSPGFWSNLWMLPTLLVPNIFGNPADGTYVWPLPTFNNYVEQAMYVGLVPLILAAGAVGAFWNKRHPAAILWWMWLATLLIALRAPGLEIVNHIPVFDMVNNNRFKWISCLMAAALAGIGFDLIFTRSPSDPLRARSARGGILLWSAGAILLVMIVVMKFLVFPLGALSADTFAHQILHEICTLKQPRSVATLIAFFGASGVLLSLAVRPDRTRRWRFVIVGLTLVELLAVAWQFNTTVPRDAVFPDSRVTRLLKEDKEAFRILSAPPYLWPNYPAAYGLSHVGAYELPVFRRYAELYRVQGGKGYKQVWEPDWPLVDFMNVKYLITGPSPVPDKFEPVLLERDFGVFRNRDCLPRAFCVRNYDVLPPREALARLTSGDFDFRNRVILENPLSQEESASLATAGHDSPSRDVVVASANLDRVALHVADGDPGLLVMSDVFAPGWRVLIDGRATTLHRANYTFRGVFVPAGEHAVVFEYRPTDYLVGAALSCLGLALVAWGVARSRTLVPSQQARIPR